MREGNRVTILDGDALRRTICEDLGYSEEDRLENCRRIAEVAKLFVESGVIVLCAVVSPLTGMRSLARTIVGPERFMEVWVRCHPAECERRDVKGHYREARAGRRPGFTGVDAPYEAPLAPDLELRTDREDEIDCAQRLNMYVRVRLGLLLKAAR
jgi:adenylyl-sulfate kinase